MAHFASAVPVPFPFPFLLLVLMIGLATKTIGADTNADNENDNQSFQNPRRLRPITITTIHTDNTANNLEKFIVNGANAATGRYPYNVILMQEDGEFYCGGSLIAPDIVLTAAHCRTPTWLGVGRHDRNTYENDYEIHQLSYAYRHPDYVKETFEFDMKLLKLKQLSTKPFIRLNDDPGLPSLIQGSAGQQHSMVTVLGFGKTSYNGLPSMTLREADLNSISNQACEQSKDPFSGYLDYQIGYEGQITDDMLCLDDLSRSGKDACTGDSGGPAILKGSSADEDVQVAIVSWGFGCALPNFPGVYARISHEIIWLRSSVCTMSEQPPADFRCDRYTRVAAAAAQNAPMIYISVRIEFALYPDRISWAFADANTRETLLYQPSTGYASIPPGSNHDQVVSIPAGSSITYSIWSNGNNGLEKFTVSYLDPTNDYNEVIILAGVGGGTVETDSATSAPHVLPSVPTNPPTEMPTQSPTGAPSQSSANPTLVPTRTTTTEPEALPRAGSLESQFPSYELTGATAGTPTQVPTFVQASSTEPSASPSRSPSNHPTEIPSNFPTAKPTMSLSPSNDPTLSQSPSTDPTIAPSAIPSNEPSALPTSDPSSEPSTNPSTMPSQMPSNEPSALPTSYASTEPSANPSDLPTTSPDGFGETPSIAPSLVESTNFAAQQEPDSATEAPGATSLTDVSDSAEPTLFLEPSGTPSEVPSVVAVRPSEFPSEVPSDSPSMVPTTPAPSVLPSSGATTSVPSFSAISAEAETHDAPHPFQPPSHPADADANPGSFAASEPSAQAGAAPTVITSTRTEDNVYTLVLQENDSNPPTSPPTASASTSGTPTSGGAASSFRTVTWCGGRVLLESLASWTTMMTMMDWIAG